MSQPAILQKITAVFQDPPPDYVFEIGPHSVAMARAVGGSQALVEELPEGTVSPSPVRDNVIDADALEKAVRKLVASTGTSRRQRRAALILPDNSARVSVLDFDVFPAKPEEQ